MNFSRRRSILSELLSRTQGMTRIALILGFVLLVCKADGIREQPTGARLLHATGTLSILAPTPKTARYKQILQQPLPETGIRTIRASISMGAPSSRPGSAWLWLLLSACVATVKIKARDGASQEQEIRDDREALLQTLFDDASDGIFIAEANGNCTDVNRAGCRMLGYSRKQLLRMNMRDIMSEEDLKKRPLRLEELRAGKSVVMERHLRKRNGDFFPVEISARMLPDGRLQGFVRDISERKRAEAALHEEVQRKRQLLHSMLDGYILADTKGKIIDVNPAYCEMIGYLREELLAMTIRQVEAALNPKQIRERIAQFMAQGWARFETRHRRKDGQAIDLEVSAVVIQSDRPLVAAFVRDMTERKRAQATARVRAAQQEAVATFGRTALVSKGVEDLFDEAVRLLAQTLRVEYSKILRIVPGESRLLLQAGVGWRKGLVGRAVVGAGKNSQAGYTLLSREPVVVADLRREKRFSGPTLLTKHGVVSGMSVIIGQKQNPYGVLGVHTAKQRTFTEDDIHFLQSMANVLAAAVDRAAAEAAIRESERRYHVLFSESPIPLWEEDFSEVKGLLEGLKRRGVKDFRRYFDRRPEVVSRCVCLVRILEINRAALRLQEADSREQLQRGLATIFTEDSYAAFKEELIAIVEHRSRPEFAATIRTLSGRKKHILLRWQVVPGYEETLERVVLSTIDVTEREQAEQRLRESEERYRVVVESAPIPIIVHCEGRVVFVNPKAVAVLGGKSAEHFLGKPALSFVEKASRGVVRKRIEALYDRTVSISPVLEEKFIRLDGSIIEVEVMGAPVTYEGKPAAQVVFSDISERKRVERTLQESETKFRVLAESTAAAILIFQGEEMIYVNPSACRISGYPEDELLQMKFWDMVHPDFQDLVKNRGLSRQRGEELEKRYEVMLVTRSGEERWVDFTASLIVFQGKPAVLGTAVDITESKQARQALLESEEKYRSLFEHNLAGVSISDASGKIYAVNDAMCVMSGYTRDELRTVNVRSLYVQPAVRKRFVESMFHDGKVENIEAEMKKKDGGTYWANFSSVRIKFEGGDSFITTVVDITERKRAEAELATHREHLEELVEQRTAELKNAQEELLRNERLAAIGQLTATVSHELRNPLATIRTSMYSINRKLRGTALGAERALERVKRNVSRCDHIIDGLLDYTRVRRMNLQRVDITVWLKEMLSDYELPAGIRLRKKLTARTFADIDADGFRRVMINLLDNACQAMQELRENQKKRLVTVENGAGESRIEIRVTDTGIGIPADRKPHIFEPLVSNKAFGVGLGLTVVKQIVEEHGGGVAVTSDEGKGTEVMLWLPQAKKQGGGS